MNVDDVVAAKVEAARMRAESERKARAARKAARDRGLAQRHAAKLRAQAACRPETPAAMQEQEKLMPNNPAIIATATTTGFKGRYVWNDGLPEQVIPLLRRLYAGPFDRHLDTMTRFLLEEHPAGWSQLGEDPDVGTGWVKGRSLIGYQHFVCHCHGDRADAPWELTEADYSPHEGTTVYILRAYGIEVWGAAADGDPWGPAPRVFPWQPFEIPDNFGDTWGPHDLVGWLHHLEASRTLLAAEYAHARAAVQQMGATALTGCQWPAVATPVPLEGAQS